MFSFLSGVYQIEMRQQGLTGWGPPWMDRKRENLGDLIADAALEAAAVKSGSGRCGRANKCAQEAEVSTVC